MKLLQRIFGSNLQEREIKRAMAAIGQLVDDESAQNDMLPSGLRELIKNAPGIDKVPSGTGRFGLNAGNPIPVNGTLGELSYLSRLETDSGERILFHRLGAEDAVDVFEAVTFSGSCWHVLYLDFNYSRRSRLAPEGFRLGSPKLFTGFTGYCTNFPYDYLQAKQRQGDLLQMSYAPLSQIQPLLQPGKMERHGAITLLRLFIDGTLTSRGQAVA